MADGVLNLLKPPGLTSHDAVQEVRRLLGERRVGHTGTLDPGAAGVLVVCCGEATKAVPFLEEEDAKEYWGEALLGTATHTLDAEGETLQTAPEGWTVTAEQVYAGAARLTGKLEQRVPLVSAVHLAGERLYRLARGGAPVEQPVRRVVVERFEIAELLPNEEGRLGTGARVRFRVTCSRGTYVRSLVDELGRLLGGFAHLGFLLRTRSGEFRLEESVTLEELAEEADPGRRLTPVAEALRYPVLQLGPAEARRFCNGAAVPGGSGQPGRRRVFGPAASGGSQGFLGVGEVGPTGILRACRLFGLGKEPAKR
ncbi:MAG TPA: tRNA pseudouridine(55) synthase TruB [Firmicutes bacterium]|nr:tRNA pseudouridine(55) synthase TruB [Bacillota bacterium]